MSDLNGYLDKLKAGEDLSFEEASKAAVALAGSEADDELKGELLVALAEKGEAADELAGFAQAFRGLARDPGLADWAHRAIDVCGTGGDKLGTFNISTTVTFVLAAGGVPVFKHGNRSITSQCGSAQLLAALGVPMEADNALLRRSLEELGFAFFFAPAFHPAFKAIMPVRQALAERGRRTIFNILGPLINPGQPAYQVLGVFSPGVMPTIAEALDSMAMKNGFVVHCDLGDGRGMDELSTVGRNLALGFGLSREVEENWDVESLGLARGGLDDLAGGTCERNLRILEKVLDNEAPPALMDTIALNAGVAFHVVGKTESVGAGIAMARELIASGAVKALVGKTRAFFAE